MTSEQRKKLALRSIATATMLAVASAASAQTCFTAFGGSVHYQFTASVANFKQRGIRNVAGVVFGALSPCAGLTHWPLVGTEDSNGREVVLGFRAITVDAAGCGAVDEIASLNPSTLDGPLQLHNDRNNFSNTNALTLASCVTAPLLAAEAAPVARGQKDPGGNSLP